MKEKLRINFDAVYPYTNGKTKTANKMLPERGMKKLFT